MTEPATPLHPTDDVVSIPVAKRDRPTFLFRLEDDDRVMTARVPKPAMMMKVGRLGGLGANMTDEQAMAAVEVLDEFLAAAIPDADDRAHLQARMEDDEDDFDFDSLQPLITELNRRSGGGRPPTSRSASGRSPARSTKRSTARARSKA